MATKDLALDKVTAYLKGEVTAEGFLAAIDALKEAQAEVTKTGKEAVGLIAQKVFKDYPELAAIRWTQYTPYFNDGETCYFSIHGVSVGFTKETEKTFPDSMTPDHEEDDDSKYFDSWSIASEYSWGGKGSDVPARFKEIKAGVEEFEGVLSSLKDTLEEAFGDHAKVTITRDGNVEIEEYEHD